MGGFNNPVVGALNLIRRAIRSPNYVPATTGWSVNQDGSAEFNAVTVRGVLDVVGTDGSYVFIRTSGGSAFVELEPPSAPGCDFRAGQIFTESSGLNKSTSMSIVGPYEFGSGTDQARIVFEGSDGTRPTSLLQLQAHDVSVTGNLTVGPLTYTAWTPVLSGGGTAAWSVQDGWYYQLGDLMFFNAYFVASGAGSGTTNITITLPVTPYRGTANRRQICTGGISDGVGTGGQLGPLACWTFAGGGAGIDRVVMSNGVNLQGQHITANSIITVQGVTRAAS